MHPGSPLWAARLCGGCWLLVLADCWRLTRLQKLAYEGKGKGKVGSHYSSIMLRADGSGCCPSHQPLFQGRKGREFCEPLRALVESD